MDLTLDIKNVRNIKEAKLTLPLNKGLYAIVGENGCGNLPKCFLPIPSVEKYLKKKCIDEPDKVFIKLIGDKYFNQRSLQNIIDDYLNDERTAKSKDNDGKNFYKVMLSNLENIDISESDFIKYICDDIYDYEKPAKFVENLRKMLS